MTADEAKQTIIKENQIWYQKKFNYLILVRMPIQSKEKLWFVLTGPSMLSTTESFIRGMEYIGELL